MTQDNSGRRTELHTERQGSWKSFIGPNLGYIQQLYERYVHDPDSVDSETRRLFQQWGAPPTYHLKADNGIQRMEAGDESITTRNVSMEKAVAAENLAQNIRAYGHLTARLDPLVEETTTEMPYEPLLDPATYELTEEDLLAIPASIMWPEAPNHITNGNDVIRHLRNVYTGSVSYQFNHVNVVEERDWLTRMVEIDAPNRDFQNEERVALLRGLTEVESFERFLHSTFPGQKRFSIEGLDVMIPMLDRMIQHGARNGVEHVMLGMAHRGRLNVLAHVLGKPYETIFAEFQPPTGKDLVPSKKSNEGDSERTGDVKYHKGAVREVKDENGSGHVRISLAHNPSHLEFVNPVVLGSTRAAQDERHRKGAPRQDVNKAFAVLIHGDAAFPGEGIVQETLNLGGLKGYRTGGTIHIIANNQIGFTTDSSDARSTKYASDMAKAFEIPVIHVNADDPEACLKAADLAYEYRKRFNKDVLIDLIGYRRFGHNEMDDPAVTQPILYSKVDTHPSVRAQYADMGKSEGWITDHQIAEMESEIQERLRNAYDQLKVSEERKTSETEPSTLQDKEGAPFETAVSMDILRRLNEDLLKWPESFRIYPKLERILKRRTNAFEQGGRVDWALAETLAFATLLREGTAIRITGQDTERGTFAHRNLILHDVQTGRTYVPLQQLPDAKSSFAVHNSPLTEAAVMGFEYGYDVYAHDTLVLWEAQYGDFANAAQVIIDTFIAAGLAKWGQHSKLVLLLPHGYEGQGPEHSNARPERFLQLAAERNWTVAYPSNAAQYFHLIRRQAAMASNNGGRPLIVMTPKGLLRNPRVTSPATELSQGTFRTIIERLSTRDDEQNIHKRQGDAARAKRLILCTGKIAIDLETELESGDYMTESIQLMSVEQLYPFPEEELKTVIQRCQALKEIVWVQEEPHNLGFWTYMEPRLHAIARAGVTVRYIGRTDRSSPAEGRPDVHKQEQERILNEALRVCEGVESNV